MQMRMLLWQASKSIFWRGTYIELSLPFNFSYLDAAFAGKIYWVKQQHTLKMN
jgi:hypothetical protein